MRLVLAGGSWPLEVGEAGVLPPASHPDLVPIEVWHGFGLRRLLLTGRPAGRREQGGKGQRNTGIWGENSLSPTSISTVILRTILSDQTPKVRGLCLDPR